MIYSSGTTKHLHGDNVSRKLHKSGIGTVKAQARVITTQEEETLWTTDVVETTSLKSLLNAVFFTVGCICAFVVETNIEISSIHSSSSVL